MVVTIVDGQVKKIESKEREFDEAAGGGTDIVAEGAVDLGRARPALRTRGGRSRLAGDESQPPGAGDPRRRLRAVGIQFHLPLPGAPVAARRAVPRGCAGARAGRTMDGLAGHRAQPGLALFILWR